MTPDMRDEAAHGNAAPTEASPLFFIGGFERDEGIALYEAAREGGKHAGLVARYIEEAAPQIARAVRSLERGVAKHLDKIENPAQYVKDWASKPSHWQAAIVKGWQREVRNYSEQAAILKELLKRQP